MLGNIDNLTVPIVDFSSLKISDLGDAIVYGGSVLALGMLTVLSVLCILWLFLFLFRIVFHDLPKKFGKKKVAVTNTPVQKVEETTHQNDEEIIAVIAAAIAMAESEGSGMNFKVVSFRRI